MNRETVSSSNRRNVDREQSSSPRPVRRSTVEANEEEVRVHTPSQNNENDGSSNKIMIIEEEVPLKENYERFLSAENEDAPFYRTKLEDLLSLREQVRETTVQLMEECLDEEGGC